MIKADPVIAGPDAVIGAFGFQFFQVGDGGDTAGGLYLKDDVPDATQQLFVLAEPLDILKLFLNSVFMPILPGP
jgi:hypothetical protein